MSDFVSHFCKQCVLNERRVYITILIGKVGCQEFLSPVAQFADTFVKLKMGKGVGLASAHTVICGPRLQLLMAEQTRTFFSKIAWLLKISEGEELIRVSAHRISG